MISLICKILKSNCSKHKWLLCQTAFIIIIIYACMYMYIYNSLISIADVSIYVGMYIYTHTHTRARARTHIHIYIYIYIYIYIMYIYFDVHWHNCSEMRELTTFPETLNIYSRRNISNIRLMFANIPCCVNRRIVLMRQATNYRGIVIESSRALLTSVHSSGDRNLILRPR